MKMLEEGHFRQTKKQCKNSLTFVRGDSRTRIAEAHRQRRRGMGDKLGEGDSG